MEVRSTIWCSTDGMVLNIHYLCITLRAQRLRRDESTRMPKLLLNVSPSSIKIFYEKDHPRLILIYFKKKEEKTKNKYNHEVEGDAPLNLALELMRDNPSK